MRECQKDGGLLLDVPMLSVASGDKPEAGTTDWTLGQRKAALIIASLPYDASVLTLAPSAVLLQTLANCELKAPEGWCQVALRQCRLELKPMQELLDSYA